MDLLTRTEIESLAEPGSGDTQVSLYMPTHRFGGGIEVDKLRWKNLVSGVESVLAQDMRRTDVEALLAPARQLQEDGMEWQYMSDGLAMFLSADGHRTYRIPATMPTLATVGDRPVVGPLLRLLSGDEHFLLLALSQQEIRLLEGSRNVLEEVQLTDVPTNLEDVIVPHEPRSDALARPAASAGRGGAAVFYGHGEGDQHVKKDEVERFLRQVASGLHDVLVGQSSPMVLVGLEHLVSAYRDVNTYGNVLEDAVDHNTDRLSTEELHALAWPVVEQRLRDERAQLIERFRELHGTGRVSSDPRTVAEAAAQGRVDTLFLKANPWCWERVAGDELPVVRLGADERYAECEQLEAAATAALATGAMVHASSQDVVEDSEIAAIFRY